MKNDKKRQNDEGHEDEPCCGPEERKKCCPDNDKSQSGCCDGGETPKDMGKCFSKCRYFPLFPVVVGTIFLLLGYFLNPEVTRMLWMIGGGLIVGLGLIGLIVIRRIAGRMGSTGCC